jgi:hypothetical protein
MLFIIYGEHLVKFVSDGIYFILFYFISCKSWNEEISRYAQNIHLANSLVHSAMELSGLFVSGIRHL